MLILPNYQWVVDMMEQRMKLFAGLVFGIICIQLLFVGIVAWYYWQALQVYLQRDDGKSDWLNPRRFSIAMPRSMSRFRFGSGGKGVALVEAKSREISIAPEQTDIGY